MPSDPVSILAIGACPSSIFLAWRIHESRSAYQVSAAWQSPASQSKIPVLSAKFGSSSAFAPAASYDPATLYSSAASQNHPLYDFIVLAPSSLKALATFPRAIAQSSLVTPGHTIILIDSTHYISLHSIVASKFPQNPVCAFYCEASLRQAPPPALQLLHSGASTKTVFSPIAPPFAAAPALAQKYKALVLALQTSGVDATIAANYEAAQWAHVLPAVSFDPLTVLLEAPTPASLVENVLSKPLYSGVAQELMHLAQKHAGVAFPQNGSSLENLVDDYVATPPFSTASGTAASGAASSAASAGGPFSSSPSSSSSSPSSNLPPYLTAPLLFYNYYHHLPVRPDLLLLHPILLADDYGIKTPYLESVFAFLSQMGFFNSLDSSVLLTRIKPKSKKNAAAAAADNAATTTTTDSLSSDSADPASQPSPLADPTDLTPPSTATTTAASSAASSAGSASEDSSASSANSSDDGSAAASSALQAKFKQLELKEHALNEREQNLIQRDAKLSHWAMSLQRQQPSGPPPPPPSSQQQQQPMVPNGPIGTPLSGIPSRTRASVSGPVPIKQQQQQRPQSYSTRPLTQPLNGMNPNMMGPPQHQNGPYMPPNNYGPPHAGGPYGNHMQPPPPPEPMLDVENLDMMSLTSRKNRRSMSTTNAGRNVRGSQSSLSLSQMQMGPNGSNNAPINGRSSAASAFRSGSSLSVVSPVPNMGGAYNNFYNNHGGPYPGRMSVTDFTLSEGLTSPTADLDTFSSLTSNRYAAVDSARLAKSRSNSLTLDSLMAKQHPNNGHVAHNSNGGCSYQQQLQMQTQQYMLQQSRGSAHSASTPVLNTGMFNNSNPYMNGNPYTENGYGNMMLPPSNGGMQPYGSATPSPGALSRRSSYTAYPPNGDGQVPSRRSSPREQQLDQIPQGMPVKRVISATTTANALSPHSSESTTVPNGDSAMAAANGGALKRTSGPTFFIGTGAA